MILRYNDKYGHQVGDLCLEQIGIFLGKFQRDHELTFFRYGGEEILAVSEAYDFTELADVAEQLVTGIAQLNINFMEISRSQ
jgi:diguanylate cyclase (GGDEF)-like protein